MTDKNKEEFYITISPEQYERKGEDYFVGTSLHTGKEVNVRLLNEDELQENGMNRINKGSYKRPEINEMITGNGDNEASRKLNRIFKKFESLAPMMDMPNVKAPDNIVLKINTCVELTDNWIGSRWIDVITGEGDSPFEMDNDTPVSANGLNDTGLYMQISRPSKFKAPANLFVETIDVKNALSASPENFSKSLSAAVDQAFKMKDNGGMPMAHVMFIDSNSKRVQFNFSYETNGETKNYSSNQFTVRTSAKEKNGWKNFKSGQESVGYALSTPNGKIVDQYLLDNPDTKIAIFPAANFIIGKNVKNKILNESKERERLTELRFKPYEINLGGKYPLKAYNKGQFSVREGTRKKGSFFITDITTTDPFNKAISLFEMSKYVTGINNNLNDNIKSEKPESEKNKTNNTEKQVQVKKIPFKF